MTPTPAEDREREEGEERQEGKDAVIRLHAIDQEHLDKLTLLTIEAEEAKKLAQQTDAKIGVVLEELKRLRGNRVANQ